MGKVSSRQVIDYNTAVRRLGSEEAAKIEEGFERLGVRGQLRRSEFRTGFLNSVVGAPVPEELGEALFNGFDTGATGRVTVHEFVCGLAVLRHGTPEEKLKLLFSVYDADRDQRLSDRDVERFAQALGGSRGATRERAVQDALQALSAAGPSVSFRRFSEWAREHIDSPLVTWLYDIEQRLAEELVQPGVRGEATGFQPGSARRTTPRASLSSTAPGDVAAELASLAREAHVEDEELVAELRAAWRGLVAESQFGVLDVAAWDKALPSVPAQLRGRLFRALAPPSPGAVSLHKWVQGIGACIVGSSAARRALCLRLFADGADAGGAEARVPLAAAEELRRLAAAAGAAFVGLEDEDAAPSESSRRGGSSAAAAPVVPPGGLLREQFMAEPWGSQAEATVRSLGRLLRVDLRLPPREPAEEREILRCLTVPFDPDQPGKKGDTWYLISSRWLEKWFESTSPDAKSRELPSIDNSALVDHGCLRIGLSDIADYRVMSAGAWRALYSWYGGPGPPLPRRVIEIDGRRELEMYPLRLHVRRTDIEGNSLLLEHTLEVSRAELLGEVQEKARALHSIDAPVSVLHRSDVYMEWLEGDAAQTLHALGFIDGHQLLLRLEGSSVSPAAAQQPPHPGQDPRAHGVVGLQNLGNTCYMNASLQCLLSTPMLPWYFTKEYLYDLNRNSTWGTGGKLAVAFSDLIAEMTRAREKGSFVIAPRAFVRTFTELLRDFAGWSQQDAQEFLSVFLTGLSDDVNRIRDKPYVELKDADGRPDAEVARETWVAHCRRECSAVSALFSGQLRSSVRCAKCGHESLTFDPFMSLQVPLPEPSFRWVPCLVVSTPRAGLVQHTVRLCARVQKRGKVGDLLRAAAEPLGLRASELVATEVLDSYVFRILKTSMLLSMLREGFRPTIFHVQQETPPSSSLFSPSGRSVVATPSGGCSGVQPARSDSSEGAVQAAATEPKIPKARNTKTVAPGMQSNEATVVVHILHRRMMKVREYFLNPYKPEIFGTPLLARLRAHCSAEELYATAWRLVRHLVPDFDPEEGCWPFSLSLVRRDGTACALCSWRQGCMGCAVAPQGELAKRLDSGSMRTFSLDWDAEVLQQHYKEKIAAHVHVDDSVELAQQERKKPEELSICLDELTKEETLEARRCSKCTRAAGVPTETPHKKQLRLWGCPPLLFLQLNRFHSGPGTSWKLHSLVRFPTQLDLRAYLAPSPAEAHPIFGESLPTAAAEGDTHSADRTQDGPQDELCFHTLARGGAVYELYGVVNHIGGMGSGHYTAYTKHRGHWFSCNDERVYAISEEDIVSANAYLLFYARKDVATKEASFRDLFPAHLSGTAPTDPDDIRRTRLRSWPWQRSSTVGSFTDALSNDATSEADSGSEADSSVGGSVLAPGGGGATGSAPGTTQRLSCANGHLVLKRKQHVRWHQHWLRTIYCSQCQERIRRDVPRWRCRFHCDFDVCHECYTRSRREHRGPSGIRKSGKEHQGSGLLETPPKVILERQLQQPPKVILERE